jgi:uncharacterized protein YjdB|nr:MAG TPA: tail tube protein [Caudoviricetes sp.]
MNKEYKIKLDLNKKLYNKKMAFNQFDENVNDFYIEVTKNNEVVKDLDKSIITLVAIKPNNAVDAQFIEVKEGQIYADLKPSMCDLVGNYQAKAMIVLEGEIVTTDTINYSVSEDKIISRLNDNVVSDERFSLFTDALSRLSTIEISEEQRVINEAERILSEENRKIEETKRVEAELIRQHEEADRAKYDATRESNENIRKQNESTRLANETNRIDEEAKRVEEEAKRVEAEQLRKDNYNFMTEDEERRRLEANAHKEAEKLRAQAEYTRVNEEAKRRTTEQARVSAEYTRVNNENTRETNETTRQTNETHRIEAETQRQNRYNSFILDAEANASNFENYTNTAKVKEEERKSNELDRKSQEDRRVSNEVERISNENTRKANEKAREKNETSRQYVFENKVNEVDKKIIEINATKDNFVSSINTKVDTKISELNTTKDNFVSSVNTKVDNKISELDNAKSDMTTTVSNKVNEVETRFNALTSSQQQDAEVIDARDGETSLKARLDRDIEKAKQVYVNVEGSCISTDSSSGYLKDVEIKGNTIQSASNLADIRSVGDKVEGQELYEIPVLSVGKNLFDGNKFTPREAINQYSYIDGILTMSCDGQAYRRVDYILPNTLVHGKRYILTANVKALEYSSGYTPGQNFGYGYYNGGSADYYGSFDASSNTAKLEFVYNEQGENVIGFHNEVKEGLTKLQWSNIQLEEGTVATQYEPYQEDKLTILSPVQLEKGDILKEVDGVWGVDKNIVDTIITGNESNTSLFTCNDGVKKYFGFVKPGNIYNIKNGIQYYHITNKLKNGNAYNGEDNVFWLFFDGSNTQLRIRLDDSYTTKEQYMEWLKSNNILVKYITTQPQFIPLPHDQQIKLRTFANKTNISFLTEIEGTIKAQVPKSLGSSINTHTEQINNLNKELDRVKKLEESTVSTVTTESDFTTVEATSNGYFEDVKLEGKTLVVNANNEVVEPGTEGATLKSVGDGVDEIVVSSVNSDNTKADKKRLLYYNEETQSWEKPILRQWDSIEKHADGKYYYHVRSIEEEYTEGDETVTDYITDMTKTVKKNSSEKVYECTNIDLITYANETNYIIECGAIAPKSTFEIHCNISNVVSMLQRKASISESNLLTSNGGGNGDHTHSNLSILNNITQTKVNEWNSKADSTHSHSEYANYSHTHNASEIEGLENVDIDLSDYYTKSETYNKTEIDSKISNMGTGGSVDLSNYYTKSETDEAMNDKANKIHTHNEYLTELPTHEHSEYLKELPTHEHEQYLTEHQDISHKADKSDIYTKFETDNKISEEIAKAQLGGSGEVDLSAYATKNYVNEEIAKIEVGDKHTHSNLSVLNNITQAKIKEWDGKADASHTHTEYASSSHTHNYADASHTHSEYAASNHTHDYASTSHTHSDYANKAHTHSTSDISNLSSYVSSLITDDVYINSLKSTIDTLSSELAKVKKDIEALKNNSGSSNIPVTGINCSEWEVNLQVGQTRQIIASVIPSSATNKLIHWYSDNTLAVDVSSNGLITAKGVGYSKVTATTDDGGHKYDIRVTVTASSGGGSGSTTTSGIKVAPESVSIERGKTVDVTISFGSDVINKNIECMSSSGAIASVSDLGSHRYRITGVGQGQTSIRFRTSDGRFEVSCSVTVTVPSSGGGGEMTSNEYEESCKSEYILDKMYPMGQAHEAIPSGLITDTWKHNSRWENQYRPTAMAHSCGQSGCPGTGAFQALGCWSNIYRVEGTPFTQNTAVEMKDIKVYGWYNGAWELVQHLPVPNGNFYPESFGGDVNKYFADSVKQTSTSKTIILREKNKIDAMNWNTGQLQTENCMYHPFSNVKNFDTKYEYIYTCIDLRKVKWDENGVDDRDNTHYCSNCGGDWWLAEGLMFHDSWQHNKGVCQPKFIEITNEWRRFSMTTVPQGWSHGFPV